MNTQIIDLGMWYTVEEATEVLSKNAGRAINPDYVRTLSSTAYGSIIRTLSLGKRAKIYLKADVDAYRVGDKPGVRKGTKLKKRPGKAASLWAGTTPKLTVL